jgi:type I restriction enzyme S subunit
MGVVTYCPTDFWPLNTALFVTDFFENDPRFAYYLLRTIDFRGFNSGSVQPMLNRNFITGIKIAIPFPDEQRRIASVLGALDDKIHTNHRLSRLYFEIVQEIYSHLMMRREKISHLSEYAELHKEPVQPSATPAAVFEHFSIPAFDAGAVAEVVAGASMLSGKTLLPDKDCVLFSKLNPGTRRVWWPRPRGVGVAVCSPEFLALVAKTDVVPISFLFAVCSFDERFYASVLAHATGTTGSRQRVKPDEVMSSPVPDVSAEELAAWDLVAGPFLARAVAAHSESLTLSALRAELLPKLISGEIRVPPDADEDELGQLAAA